MIIRIFNLIYRALQQPLTSFLAEQDRWVLWIPVLLGLGIAGGLMAPQSLSFTALIVAGALALLCGGVACWQKSKILPLVLGHLGFWCIGGMVWSTVYVEYIYGTPLLTQPTPPLWITGRIAHAEQRPYGYRLLIDHLNLPAGLHLQSKPLQAYHHIALLLKQPLSAEEKQHLSPGTLIQQYTVLTPWSGPEIPGGYHPARFAAFNGCIAQGYGLAKPEIRLSPTTSTLSSLRHRLNQYLEQGLSSTASPIAQALVTGEKGSIPLSIREDFAKTGLAHLLAISGLHMSLVMGIGFILSRKILSLIPFLMCRYDPKKLALWPGIFLGGFYLMISGTAIPAQRAFIMGWVVFGAILMNRESLSMRTLAFAALLILLVFPPALLSVSFQLSFSAVVGLLGFYEYRQNRMTPSSGRSVLWKYLGGAITTSAVATLATFPIILFTFNRFTLHSITANLIAVPWTCFFIIPLGMGCLVTAAWGGHITALWGWWDHSIRALNAFASIISAWPGSDIAGPTPSLAIYLSVILGFLWLALWKKTWRLWGTIPIMGGFICYLMAPQPHILIDRLGQQTGVYHHKTLYVSSLQKKRICKIWAQSLAAQALQGFPRTWAHTPPPYIIQHQKTGETWAWVLSERTPEGMRVRYTIFPKDLVERGAHSFWEGPSSWVCQTVYTCQGRRYWDL